MIQVKLPNNYHKIIVTIRNSIGQILLIKELNSISLFNLNLNGPAGIYFIEIQGDDEYFKNTCIVKS
ncbi:MAG: T9SS type A sorting domain-containing protein [Bacteroidetes bacterium]|nr:T9SS type A sorting domain-containing protein [Bacteroidota bacterium]